MGTLRLALALMIALGLSGCGSAQDTVMPDVVDLKLEVALSDIKRAGVADEVEVLGGGLFGVVDKANWQVCDQEPPAGQVVTVAPRLTVDRSCGDSASEPGTQPSENPTQVSAPEESEPEADTYTYRGPQYEIVSVDEGQSAAKLNQYWLYTSKLDPSKDPYKSQVRMIIADIARIQDTDKFFAEVVIDKEIAQAESPSTYESFIEQHGIDYALKTIPKKEKAGWVASYAGGFDYEVGKPSESAFEIEWWPAANTESETWKPETVR